MDFFGDLGASTREALGWESDGELDSDAWNPPSLSCRVVRTLLRCGLTSEVKHFMCSDEGPVEGALLVGAGNEWGVLAGTALEWNCLYKDGRYQHGGTLELPLSEVDGAKAVAMISDNDASYGVRYERPDALRAAHFGVETLGGAAGWMVPRSLPYAAGLRHGSLAAGLKGAVELTDRGTSTVLAPAFRLGFDDKTVSAHFFLEGQPYTAVGGCCQWRPSFTPRIKISGGLKYAIDVVADKVNGREFHLIMDEGVVCVQYEYDQTLSTQLRVRRRYGPELVAQQSAVQYSVQKELADDVSVELFWQSPLSSVARYCTHNVGFSIVVGGG